MRRLALLKLIYALVLILLILLIGIKAYASSMSGASKLYDDFRGRPASRTFTVGVKFGRTWVTQPGRLNLVIPAELAVMGHVAGISYDTTRDGKLLRAEHTFEAGSRPLLVAGDRPGQIFLLGQRFQWTDRGIMDIDARGRLIDDPKGLPRR